MTATRTAHFGALAAAIATATRAAEAFIARKEDDRIWRMRWTPPQEAFLRSVKRETLLRMGNQGGKSWCGLAEVIFRCLGRHPFKAVKKPGPGFEVWVLCASSTQSIAIQQKFWALVPKSELTDRTINKYTEEGGFGRDRTVTFRNGAIVRFKTTEQGKGRNAMRRLASATIDYVLIDEPTTARMFNELRKRLIRKRGDMGLTITPINGDVEFLQKRVEAGQMTDLHYRLEPQNFVPNDGENRPVELEDEGHTPMDAQWVQGEIDATDPDEVDVTCHGEWPSGLMDRQIRAFRDAHIFDAYPADTQIMGWGAGFDHGEGAGREVMLLAMWDSKGTLWVTGEHVSTGHTGLEDDAKGFARVVDDDGIRLDQVNVVVGDLNSAGQLGRGMTVNQLLEGYFANLNGGKVPFQIRGAYKQGSAGPDDRARVLNTAFASGRVRVHRSCKRLIDALRMWRGRGRTLRDPIDALGYLWTEVFPILAAGPRRMGMRRG